MVRRMKNIKQRLGSYFFFANSAKHVNGWWVIETGKDVFDENWLNACGTFLNRDLKNNNVLLTSAR